MIASGGHVLKRSDGNVGIVCVPRLALRVQLNVASEAEIDNFQLPVLPNHNVFGFDIPMNDAPFMRGVERFQQLPPNLRIC